MSGDDVTLPKPLFPSDPGEAVDGECERPRPVNPPLAPGLLNGDFSRIDTIVGAFKQLVVHDRSFRSFYASVDFCGSSARALDPI